MYFFLAEFPGNGFNFLELSGELGSDGGREFGILDEILEVPVGFQQMPVGFSRPRFDAFLARISPVSQS